MNKQVTLVVRFYAQQRCFELQAISKHGTTVLASVMLTDCITRLDEAIRVALNAYAALDIQVDDQTSKGRW